jgi:hypothetical protein
MLCRRGSYLTTDTAPMRYRPTCVVKLIHSNPGYIAGGNDSENRHALDFSLFGLPSCGCSACSSGCVGCVHHRFMHRESLGATSLLTVSSVSRVDRHMPFYMSAGMQSVCRMLPPSVLRVFHQGGRALGVPARHGMAPQWHDGSVVFSHTFISEAVLMPSLGCTCAVGIMHACS